ncbi:hypothetical protein SDC9_183925 [bioreactor metagenome]|uniref:Uncharacterized protein n=1 Tax=bioreactor metagenome TaxID=1076179 RepID=A0A645HD12_9ZZZZ
MIAAQCALASKIDEVIVQLNIPFAKGFLDPLKAFLVNVAFLVFIVENRKFGVPHLQAFNGQVIGSGFIVNQDAAQLSGFVRHTAQNNLARSVDQVVS